MKSLMWTAATAALLVIGLALTPAGAQNPAPSPPQNQVPSFVTNPWGNPIVSYYQRQRELRENATLQQSIQQLQKLELLKARNRATAEKPAEPQTSTSQPVPKTSMTYKPTPKKAVPDKMPKVRRAADGGATEPEPTTVEKKGPQKAGTFSNYDAILGKKPK